MCFDIQQIMDFFASVLEDVDLLDYCLLCQRNLALDLLAYDFLPPGVSRILASMDAFVYRREDTYVDGMKWYDVSALSGHDEQIMSLMPLFLCR